jgi:hypothetical protein
MPVFYTPVMGAFGQNLQYSDGAKLYFFEVGATTPKTTYSDPGETVAQAHPVVANDAGRFDAIFLSGSYKVVLKDKNDVTYWTEDNITGAGNSWSDQGDFDSSTNSGDYPSTGNDNDVYRVTEEFVLNATSGSHRVFIGDFIKANKAGATGVDADWDIIKGVSVNVNTVALTAGATIATNCKIGTSFTVTLDQNSTLSNPTNKRIGQTYTWIITNGATPYTLAFGTDFSFAGDSTIKPTAAAVTIITGRCVSNTSVVCEMFYYQDYSVDFETKNLLIDVASNTTVTMSADRMSFLNSTSWPKYSDNISETYDITTDLMAGTSEKASHWYQLWYDSDGTRMMVPDLTGTADTDTANKLVDSTADFVTDKVSIGDIVYNTTDLTQGTVTAIDDLNTLSLSSDVFPDGDETYKIRMLSPTGLGTYKSRLGAAYNNGSSNLDDSAYTQHQELKSYSEAAGNFTITPSGGTWTTDFSLFIPFQVNDNDWRAFLSFSGTTDSTAAKTIAVSGVTFKSEVGLLLTQKGGTSVFQAYCRTQAASSNIAYGFNSALTGPLISGIVDLASKPTFHT